MTIDLRLAPGLRMIGAILLLRLYFFIGWTRKLVLQLISAVEAKESTSRRVGSVGMSVSGFVRVCMYMYIYMYI